MLFPVDKIELVNASQYGGDLVGREIVVDAVNHSAWFKEAAGSSGLTIYDVFRVESVDRFGETRYLNFVCEDRRARAEYVRRGRYDGCGEAYRFNVLVPR